MATTASTSATCLGQQSQAAATERVVIVVYIIEAAKFLPVGIFILSIAAWAMVLT